MNILLHGNGRKSHFLIGQIFPEWLFVAGTCADNIHLYIQNYLDNRIFQQFIMIRKLVLVNETVTDFCCVLNFSNTKGSCTVF